MTKSEVESILAELENLFEKWFLETNIDFWRENNAPRELAEIATEMLAGRDSTSLEASLASIASSVARVAEALDRRARGDLMRTEDL